MNPSSVPDARETGLRARGVALTVGLVAGVALFQALAARYEGFRGDEVGLGLNTVAFQRTEAAQGRLRSGSFGDAPALAARLRALRSEGREVALWLGASQLHAINTPAPGDRLAVAVADEAARTRGGRMAYLQLTAPNANIQEHLALAVKLREQGVRPDWLIIAMTYDDLDEPDLRDGFTGLDPEAVAALASSCGPGMARLAATARAKAAAQPGAAPTTTAPVKRDAEGTAQERLEGALVSRLERAWPAYARRGLVRAGLETSWKIPLTRLAFRIGGRPGNAIDPAFEAKNMEALDALLALARQDGMRVLIYKAPHKPGEQPFLHPRAEYDAFHARLRERCEREGLAWLDLETLVPADVWGLTNEGLPDVFHFQGSGHTLLGGAIDAWFAAQGR
jgi:hypothetical protein